MKIYLESQGHGGRDDLKLPIGPTDKHEIKGYPALVISWKGHVFLSMWWDILGGKGFRPEYSKSIGIHHSCLNKVK
jgi:hypothetical protein